MERTILLHVGLPKTGTTSLQEFLGANAVALLRQGFAYPLLGRKRDHKALAISAMDWQSGRDEPLRGPFFHRGIATEADLEAYRATVAESFRTTMEALPPEVSTVILSCEHLSAFGAGELRRLRRLLLGFADDVRVFGYFRRQDRYAVSIYSSYLRNGYRGSLEDLLSDLRDERTMPYDEVADTFAEVFGQEKLACCLFEDALTEADDIVVDFCRRHGIDGRELESPPRSNLAISREGQDFLRAFNRIQPTRPEGVERRMLALLNRVIEAGYLGEGYLPGRAAAMAFAESFAENNRRFRERWFPERERLFDEDFSRYPDSGGAVQAAIPEAPYRVAIDILRRWAEAEQEAPKQPRRGKGRQQAEKRGGRAREPLPAKRASLRPAGQTKRPKI